MDELQIALEKWEKELLTPSKLDVLVNCFAGNKAISIDVDHWEAMNFSLPASTTLLKLLKEGSGIQKESGFTPLAISSKRISFQLDGTDYQIPLFLQSVEAKYKRLNNTVFFQQIEEVYVNPFLEKLLNVSLPANEDELKLILLDQGLDVQFEDVYFLANFHPHRFFLVKELSLLKEKNKRETPLSDIFGEHSNQLDYSFPSDYLFSADPYQLEALASVEKENTVIQGPPGTGKSQVIGNLLGKIIAAENNALVLAEKQTALSVIYTKFKEKNLHHFCLPYHHQVKGKQLYENLKNTWLFLEQLPSDTSSHISLGNLKRRKVQHALDVLQQQEVIGGISLLEFYHRYFSRMGDQAMTRELETAPDFPIWERDKKRLKQLVGKIGAWVLVKCSQNQLDSSFLSALSSAIKAAKSLNIHQTTIHKLEEQRRLFALSNLFFFRGILLPREYLLGEKKGKYLKKWSDRLIFLDEKITLLEKEKSAWKKDFNWSETSAYITALSTTNRWNIRTWRKRKELLKFTTLDFSGAILALKKLKELNELELERVELKNELRQNNLPDNSLELNHMTFVHQQLKQVPQNRLKHLIELKEDELKSLQEKETEVTQVLDFLRQYSCLPADAEVMEFLSHLEQHTSEVVENSKILSDISDSTKKMIVKFGDTAAVEAALITYHWQRFIGQFPEYKSFSGQNMLEDVFAWQAELKSDQHKFALAIQQKWANKFKYYHEILQTPARKLTENEKLLKKKLRKGKSILVKEFGKSRQHLTLLELMNSDAFLWLQVLKPIFLASPYSVAKSFPLQEQLFDFLIIDEGSQMPVSHAAGSLFRASRVVVAGDDQQMSPSVYSKGGGAGRVTDVLHQASFYWKNTMLKFHYRSESPVLMEFSNRYFYKDDLVLFPSKNKDNPFELISLEGRFIDRVNYEEAVWIAQRVKEKIKHQVFDFGVVAFSKKQLDAILNELSPSDQDLVFNEENGILWTSLEELQGEECDHLFVSLGYGKNKEGKFYFRMGALNQLDGHKRLNVLMSRAKKKLTFVRSVGSEDFTISENEGVDLLRKLMVFLEERAENKQFESSPSQMIIKENKVVLSNKFLKHVSSPEELLTVVGSLSDRNWKVEIDVVGDE